jgi:hypothetical protein
VIVVSKGVYVEPDRTLERVVQVLRERGRTVVVASPEWQRYFPGRKS